MSQISPRLSWLAFKDVSPLPQFPLLGGFGVFIIGGGLLRLFGEQAAAFFQWQAMEGSALFKGHWLFSLNLAFLCNHWLASFHPKLKPFSI
jgi:hypothetical protein